MASCFACASSTPARCGSRAITASAWRPTARHSASLLSDPGQPECANILQSLEVLRPTRDYERKFRANLVKGGRTAPAAGRVMRNALRLEGPIGRTGNRQEPPSDQVLARQAEIMFGDPRHLRVRENPAIELPPLPLRLPGQAEVAPTNLGAGVIPPDQISQTNDGELQGLPQASDLTFKPTADGPGQRVAHAAGVFTNFPLHGPLLSESRAS